MKGRRRPYHDLQVSESEPKIGDTKKPIKGLKHQIMDVLSMGSPAVNRVGVTNAVSAE